MPNFPIFPGIEIIGSFPALFIRPLHAVVISDIHLGYEGWRAETAGEAIPKVQYKEIIQIMEQIAAWMGKIKTKREKLLIVTGDIRPGFSQLTIHEYLEVRNFLDWAKQHFQKIIIIRGNHDNYIQGIAQRKEAEFPKEKLIGRFLFHHGDSLPGTPEKEYDYLIFGHEHPALALRGKRRREKMKAFLYGTVKFQKAKKNIIVIPAMSVFAEGTAMNEAETFLSPILQKIDVSKLKAAGLLEGEGVLAFPELGKMRKAINK